MGFRDTGYLPSYFQGYRIPSILPPGIWNTVFNILVTFRDIEYLGKLIMGVTCQFIRDTCLFTSRDMGYLVPPIHASTVIRTTFFDEGCSYLVN